MYEMNTPESFKRLYANVSDNISSAMADILSLNVEHKDGKREIGNITDKLRDIQVRFDNELLQLETQAEWDTFTLAFFGETNAGKSTIIESLRILFNEESRQALLEQNEYDLEQFTQVLSSHIESVREGLLAVYIEYTGELATINQSIDRLMQIAQSEAQERLEVQQQEAEYRQQLAEQESRARLEAERKEALQRLQIEESHALSRFKVRLALFIGGGVVIGAAATVALLMLIGV